jgi:hypothetical protein
MGKMTNEEFAEELFNQWKATKKVHQSFVHHLQRMSRYFIANCA